MTDATYMVLYVIVGLGLAMGLALIAYSLSTWPRVHVEDAHTIPTYCPDCGLRIGRVHGVKPNGRIVCSSCIVKYLGQGGARVQR